MPICPNCNELTASAELALGMCPRCREQSPENSLPSTHWQSVAQVANLAEAGYLTSCLVAEGIEARLHESESFSALAGNWSRSYLVQVAAQSADSARTILSAEAREFELDEPECDAFGEPIDAEPLHLVLWRPIALMAVAGLATLWLSQRLPDPRPRIAPHRNAAELAAAVEAAGKPFVVQGENGQVQHRLQYQAADRTWCLDSDTDGDGKLDRHQQFALETAGP